VTERDLGVVVFVGLTDELESKSKPMPCDAPEWLLRGMVV